MNNKLGVRVIEDEIRQKKGVPYREGGKWKPQYDLIRLVLLW